MSFTLLSWVTNSRTFRRCLLTPFTFTSEPAAYEEWDRVQYAANRKEISLSVPFRGLQGSKPIPSFWQTSARSSSTSLFRRLYCCCRLTHGDRPMYLLISASCNVHVHNVHVDNVHVYHIRVHIDDDSETNSSKSQSDSTDGCQAVRRLDFNPLPNQACANKPLLF